MKLLFSIAAFLIVNSSLSQPNWIKVKNKANLPVPFATLIIKKNNSFYIADSAGWLPEKLVQKIKEGDTVLLSAIGYESAIDVFYEEKEFVLKEQIIELPEVVLVNGEGKNEIWGSAEHGTYCTQGFENPNFILARIVYPLGKALKAEIQSVSFLDKMGHGLNAPLRVRIFFIGKDSLPTGDYLKENIILNTKGKGWIEKDLRNLGLIIPKEGLAFGVELFENREEYYFTDTRRTGDGKKYKQEMYGVKLAREKDKNNLTLVKFNGWNQWMIDRVGHKYCGNLVCRVKVKVWR